MTLFLKICIDYHPLIDLTLFVSLVLLKMFEFIVLFSIVVDSKIEVEFYVSWNLVSFSYLQFHTLQEDLETKELFLIKMYNVC